MMNTRRGQKTTVLLSEEDYTALRDLQDQYGIGGMEALSRALVYGLKEIEDQGLSPSLSGILTREQEITLLKAEAEQLVKAVEKHGLSKKRVTWEAAFGCGKGMKRLRREKAEQRSEEKRQAVMRPVGARGPDSPRRLRPTAMVIYGD